MRNVSQFNSQRNRDSIYPIWLPTVVYNFQHDLAPAQMAKFSQFSFSSHSLCFSHTAFLSLFQASVSLLIWLLSLSPSLSPSISLSLPLLFPVFLEYSSPTKSTWQTFILNAVTSGRPFRTTLFKEDFLMILFFPLSFIICITIWDFKIYVFTFLYLSLLTSRHAAREEGNCWS